ncbi:MAG TPA: Fe(2+)-trafficking protein [Gemmatimonadota bacterium]
MTCARCGRTAEALPFPPYPDELGALIQRRICPACWSECLRRQTMVINEYRLDLLDPQAQEILTQDAIEFLGLQAEAGGTEATGGTEAAETR